MVCLPSDCPLSFVIYPRWSVKKNNTSDLLVGDLFDLGLGSRKPSRIVAWNIWATLFPPTGELLSLSLEVLANP